MKNIADLASDEDVHAFDYMTKVVDIRNHQGFFNVEESQILSAWFNQKNLYPDEDNDYDPILMRSQFFNKHGLTPLYYVDPDTNRVFVTSEEFLDGKFH